MTNLKENQERYREIYATKQSQPLASLEEARARKPEIDWETTDISTPSFLGRKVLENVSLRDIRPFVDWSPFFYTWGLRGKFPAILKSEKYGEVATEVYEQGRALLGKILDEERLTANGVYGFWPANSDGDDIVLFTDDTRETELMRFPMLRRQRIVDDSKPMRSLADYVAPIASGRKDYVGAFAVTAGIGSDAFAREFEKENDDYQAIMVKALADRMAEAFAEMLHARVRQEWGYEQADELDHEQLIGEKYRGIRPAFGYPACPDHTEKDKLFSLLEAESVGISLTSSFAMKPGASVSGLYFAHPDAKYFSVGRISKEQVEDYATRKQMSVAEVEQWLTPNLGYDPEANK